MDTLCLETDGQKKLRPGSTEGVNVRMLIDMAEKNGGGCPGPNDRLDREQTDKRLKGLQPAWRIEEGHHPDLELGWGRVAVTLFSHSAGGLTENDFVLASRIDGLEKG